MLVARLWVKRFRRGPMDEVSSVALVAGRGIEGNADQRGWRQVTLLSAERWARVEADLGRPLDPVARRANVLLTGVDLAGSRGRVLRVGSTRLQVTVETVGCRLLDLAEPGLQAALAGDWGGGASARVLTGGPVAVGDEAAWE